MEGVWGFGWEGVLRHVYWRGGGVGGVGSTAPVVWRGGGGFVGGEAGDH